MAATPKAQWTDTSRGSNVPVRRGVPLWVFAVALTVGIVLVSCLVIGLLVAVIPPDVPTAAATAAPLPVPVSPARDNVSPVTRNDPPVVTTKGPPVKEYGVGELIRIGDIGLIVMKARVEPFASVDAIGQPQEQNAQFVVRMGMQSLNPNRVVDVESQADVARAEDDVGNTYRALTARTEFGLPARIFGQIPPGRSVGVRPDEPQSDVLVFERPVPGASCIKLTLDASRYGGTGTVRLNIPFKQVFKVRVAANRAWQDTKIFTPDGAELTVTCKGKWGKAGATCTESGFAPDVDPTAAALRALHDDWQKAMTDYHGLVEQNRQATGGAPGGSGIVLRAMPGESRQAYMRRLEAYRKAQEAMTARVNEAHRKMREADARMKEEEARLESRRLIAKAPLMSLVAKLGEKETPFVLADKFTASSSNSGRLYLQPNDLDLEQNSGELEVEIVLRR